MSKDDLSAASRRKVGAAPARALTAAGRTTLHQLGGCHAPASCTSCTSCTEWAAGDQDPQRDPEHPRSITSAVDPVGVEPTLART